MDAIVERFANVYVLSYLLLIFALQFAYAGWLRWRRHHIASRRRAQGLPDAILINNSERLSERRRHALVQSGLLLGSILLLPFILVWLAPQLEGGAADLERSGVIIVFLALLVWLALEGTDVAKAFLGGLAFKTLAAFKNPFQLGDRVTLKGIGGKVVGFNTFFVTLATPNDDLVNIPTASLWNEVLNSANAGERGSLCVMNFYLAPFISAEQRQAAEDRLWDAIQASVYFDPTKPFQIYLSQTPTFIQVTAKAYVASTYDDPLFTSDVTRTFLDFASAHNIPLAARSWPILVPPAEQPIES